MCFWYYIKVKPSSFQRHIQLKPSINNQETPKIENTMRNRSECCTNEREELIGSISSSRVKIHLCLVGYDRVWEKSHISMQIQMKILTLGNNAMYNFEFHHKVPISLQYTIYNIQHKLLTNSHLEYEPWADTC